MGLVSDRQQNNKVTGLLKQNIFEHYNNKFFKDIILKLTSEEYDL